MNYKKAVPGAVVAIQSFGDFLGFNPHLYVLISDPPEADFHENGMFSVSPAIDTEALEQIFRRMVLRMLLAKRKITAAMIRGLRRWSVMWERMLVLRCFETLLFLLITLYFPVVLLR